MKTKGIYFLYRALQAFGMPALLLYFLYRALRERKYWRSLPERLGFLPPSFRQTGPGAIWLHAVSVGEVLSCVGFLRRLRAEFPQTRIFVSSATLAGRATAGEKLKDVADGVFFAPLDFVFAVRRVLRAVQPWAVVVAETEIWPNLFREVKRTGAALAIVNGRISDRAYPRYRRFAWLFRAVLPAADAILAQTDEIRERFLVLGAPPERTRSAGNFKYDFDASPAPADSPVMRLMEKIRPSHVWIAASTMPPAEAGDPDEDDVVIQTFQQLAASHTGLLLIHAPRKPAAFDAVAARLAASQIPYLRRSAMAQDAELRLPGVLLLDTIGELAGLFAAADVVFMGGTLPHRGGHNILEPALFGKSVIVGRHMENFQAIADEFRAAGAFLEIREASELAGAVAHLLDQPDAARAIGERARVAAESKRGASAAAVEEVRRLSLDCEPRYRPALPWLAFAWTMARGWEWGGRLRHAGDLRDQRKLDTPVVSIGNLTMGGTGKTPCVVRVSELLKAHGHKPGILTRGYGRASAEERIVLEPGASVPTEVTGDEPQIFLRSGVAPVGIGGDRVRTGWLLRERFDIDVLLLDDGFQHLRLARDVDIVLIDALNPFGGGDVFPLGRLREPMGSLERADVVLITRCEISGAVPAIEQAVKRRNPRAPVFRAWIEPEAWVERRTGVRHGLSQPPFGRVAGFCGLGNPQGFLRTLRRMGVDPVDWLEFGDHHRYRPYELRRIAGQFQAAGASALVTTEKDAANLCESSEDLLAPLPLFWLQIGMRIDREDEFIGEILRRCFRKK